MRAACDDFRYHFKILVRLMLCHGISKSPVFSVNLCWSGLFLARMPHCTGNQRQLHPTCPFVSCARSVVSTADTYHAQWFFQ